MEFRSEDVPVPQLAELLRDRLDCNLRILDISEAEATLLGSARATLIGRSASAIYDDHTVERLVKMLATTLERPTCCPATLLHADGSALNFAAIVIPQRDEDGTPCFDIYKADAFNMSDEIDALTASSKVMWDIIQMAREAIWCIDYEEPVDVTGSLEDIIDGIFERPSFWGICNEAMARAYDLPGAAYLSTRSVRFHWPRNPVNEAFVREVIENDFRVDGALSEDYRQDGVPVLVENDVRAHIVGGKLYRLWGTLRELQPAQEIASPRSAELAAGGFDLLPVAAAVISGDGALLAANGLWHATFSVVPDSVERIIYRGLAGASETASGGLLAPRAVMLRERDGADPRLYSVQGRWHNPGRNRKALLVVTATLMEGGHQE